MVMHWEAKTSAKRGKMPVGITCKGFTPLIRMLFIQQCTRQKPIIAYIPWDLLTVAENNLFSDFFCVLKL